jgi:MSHA pilin protein MshA
MSRKNGFTLVELVMVIVILGILAIVAIPKFFSLQDDAKEAAEKGVVGAVRSGISNYFAANKGVWPATLDSATNAACSSSNICFGTVLNSGMTADWTKNSSTTYTGPKSSYTYYPTTGEFK